MSNAELRIKAQIKAELDQERGRYDIFKLVPNRIQHIFWNVGVVENGILVPPRTRVTQAGNRSGKSRSGLDEDVFWCLGRREIFPTNHPAYWTPFEPPIRGRIITESLNSTAKDAIAPALEEIIPPRYIDHVEKNSQGVIIGVYFTCGSMLRIMSFDQALKNFESTAFHFNHYDEPPPQRIYEAAERALTDYHGFSWITMTHLTQPWIKRDIVQQADIVFDYDVWPEEQELRRPAKIVLIKGKIWDNVIQPRPDDGRICGGLKKEAAEEYLNKVKDPRMRKVRETGEATHFSGSVYPVDDIHIIKEGQEKEHFALKEYNGQIQPWWTHGMCVDPHETKPYAMAWWCITPRGDLIFYDEYPDDYFHLMDKDDKNVKTLCDIILAKEHGQHIEYRVMDKHYLKKPSMTTKRELGMEFALESNNQLIFIPSEEDNDIHKVIQLTTELFYYNRDAEVSEINRPKVYFMERCANMIYGLNNYYYKDISSRQEANIDFIEKPSEKNKCFPNLIDWVAALNPDWIKPSAPAPRDKFSTEQVIGAKRRMVIAKKKGTWVGGRKGTRISGIKSRSKLYARN